MARCRFVESKNAPIKKLGNPTINKLWSTLKNTSKIISFIIKHIKK
jgi:hypothetical protein